MAIQRKKIAVVTIGGTMFMHGETLSPGEVQLPTLEPRKTFQGRIETQKPRQLELFPSRVKIPLDRVFAEEVEVQHEHLFNIDSSQVRAYHLDRLASKIAHLSRDPSINGIVVVSGTDKMHRIATRMAHHLHNLNTPVVFTGASTPIMRPGSDARRNYEQAIRAAIDLGKTGINQVVLSFGRGKRELGSEVHHTLNALKANTEQDLFNHQFKRVVATVTPDKGTQLTDIGRELGIKAREARQKRRGKYKPLLHTTFTPVKKDLLEIVEIPETKSIQKIRISPSAKAIVIRAAGKGHVPKRAITLIERLSTGRPVVITSEAGADVNLASYIAGREALQRGMLPSGGLITPSAEIRLEYLAHKMNEITAFAKSQCPRSQNSDAYKARLVAALFLSGAKFRGKNTRKKHEQALKTVIPKHDVIINRTIEAALIRAKHAVEKFKPRAAPSA